MMNRSQEALRQRRKAKDAAVSQAWKWRLAIWGAILFVPGLIIGYHLISGRPFKAIWDEKTRYCWEADSLGMDDTGQFSAPVMLWREANFVKDKYEFHLGGGATTVTEYKLPDWAFEKDVYARKHYPIYYKVKQARKEAHGSVPWYWFP